jgi:hypothetical protein
MRRSRRVLGSIVASALALTVPVAAAPAAWAAPPIICEGGAIRYRITSSTTVGRLNGGAVILTVPPGGSSTVSVQTQTTFSASVTADVEGSFSAGIIIAKAEAKVGFSLQISGARTVIHTVSITANNNTSNYHDWIFFDGEKTANGRWIKERCSSNGTVWTQALAGPWRSWEIQTYGSVRCDHDSVIADQYGTNSPQYTAAKLC